MPRQITISDGNGSSVTLLKDLVFTISPQNVGGQVQTASGRIVLDIIGVRNELDIPTGWLSIADLTTLKSMINQTHLLWVTYPDIDGEKTEQFLVDQPSYKAFKYSDDGVEQWCGISLHMTSQKLTETIL